MSVNREVGQTDDLRLLGLLTGGGSGGYMYNYGPSGAPSNQPPNAFQQGLTRGPVSMTGMSDAQTQSLIDQRLDARALDMNEGIDLPDQGDDPFETGGVEDNVYEMLYAIMAGQPGIPGETSPELLRELESVLAGANQDQIEAIAQQIQAAGGFDQWLAGQEEEVDPNDSTVPGDTTGGDTTTDGDEEEEEGWLDRLGNWWDSVVNSVGGGSSPPTLPGSSGVIISPGSSGMSWPQVLSNPGGWQVFLPGVIPGLPQSPTIIGTIEDILSSPGDVLGDLWEQVQNTVENPGEFLEDLLNGVVDEDGNVTVGGISTIVGSIYDDLFGEDDTTTTPGTEDEVEGDLPLGGADDSDPRQSPDFPGGEAPVPDQEDDPIGGAEDGSSDGGGGGGGRVPTGGNAKDYMYRLQYNPDAPVSVPGGMLTNAPQRRKLRAPELGQPSMVQGLLLGRT